MKNFVGIAVSAAAILLPAALIFALSGPASALFSQYLGLAALVAMSLSQLMATRARFVERIFGPLDQAYVLHKWLGIVALVAILLHDNIGAEIKALGRGTALSGFGEDLGEQSLNGLLVLIAITLITIIPYRIWYWTHKAMGVCFVLGAVHFILVLKPFSVFDPLGLYVLGFCIIGVLSYAYTLLPRWWRTGYAYRVTGVEKTGHGIAIEMVPEGQALGHRAGQFAFFSFDLPGLSESHPFTISSAPRADGSLRITVANLGDYTARLARQLEEGASVSVQGPYGRFFPSRGKRAQVWVAGGIGITPFLAWLEAMEGDGPKVDLVWTFRGSLSAPHLAEVKALVARTDRVSLHLIDTSMGTRLTPEALGEIADLKAASVSYCGPMALQEILRGAVGRWRLHTEAFEIRTGLPLPNRLRGLIAGLPLRLRAAS